MTKSQMQPIETAARAPIATIIGISVVATLFLLWLVYVHPPSQEYASRLLFLPALNALFNGMSAVALLIGLSYIRKRKIAAHRASMLTALVFSVLFLITYTTNHALHGDMYFHGHGAIRTAYLGLLISHILLSVVALPMILITFFFSLTGRFPQHKKIAPYTFPIWLYVSVTGVVVYVMLVAWR
jgi:putative membrane protein